jgi:hypothetical protein
MARYPAGYDEMMYTATAASNGASTSWSWRVPPSTNDHGQHQLPVPPPPQKHQKEEVETEAAALLRRRSLKYPLLAHLQIPLGNQKLDNDRRMAILSEILHFQEHEFRSEGDDITSTCSDKENSTGSAAINEISNGMLSVDNEDIMDVKGAIKVTKRKSHTLEHVVRIPQFKLTPQSIKKKRSPTDMQFLEIILNCLFAVAPTKAAEGRDAAATMILDYMARNYNQQYYDQTELAQGIAKRRRPNSKEKKQPVKLPDNLIIRDDSDTQNPNNVQWNIMYQRLLDYKTKYGDLSVRTLDQREHDKTLTGWVLTQRTKYKNEFSSLTPKRIELLESIGFLWVVRPNMFNSAECVEYHKAVAAKLCFGMSAVDAMVLANLPEEESKHDSRKKLFNSHACNLYKKNGRASTIKPLVEIWLHKLYDAPEEDLWTVVQDIFGDSDMLNNLYDAGSLVLNPLHPSKRRRTDETLTEDGKPYVCHKPKAR